MVRRNKEKVFCRMPFWHADRRLFMNSQLKTKDKTSHGHGAEITRIVEYRNRFTPCCAQGHHERQEMIRRGDGIGGIGMRGVVDDGVIIMIPHGLDNVVVETQSEACHRGYSIRRVPGCGRRCHWQKSDIPEYAAAPVSGRGHTVPVAIDHDLRRAGRREYRRRGTCGPIWSMCRGRCPTGH